MLKKTFLGVLFAVLILALLIAGINFSVTKARAIYIGKIRMELVTKE